ncbi:hypothetical protein C8A05DRAFT_33813 [Staphylotrichum tortipilum]|uniref:Uncharacterized protein n=1 Tax=Staphylotrichum tortipilum TaxID=2831512 RepID=A0AAN6RTK5_9PEZI|nr:hypothetical protein C8A05DRAFT_33813 [Staphylotrichum longicolle]
MAAFFNSTPIRDGKWWPLEREARNIAILEKVQASLRRSDPIPIHVPEKRAHRLDCLRCLYYLSPVDPRFDGVGAFHEVPSAEFLLYRNEVMERSKREWNERNERLDQGIGPTEDEQRAQEREWAAEETAEFIERGYRRGQWDASYFVLRKEDRARLKLDEDPLAIICIRGVEPKAVLDAWRAYSKQKREYLPRVATGGSSKPES